MMTAFFGFVLALPAACCAARALAHPLRLPVLLPLFAVNAALAICMAALSTLLRPRTCMSLPASPALAAPLRLSMPAAPSCNEGMGPCEDPRQQRIPR
ncbi:MAG: hypothetical protein ACI4NA_03870, partial [Succinivibrio sp.]